MGLFYSIFTRIQIPHWKKAFYVLKFWIEDVDPQHLHLGQATRHNFSSIQWVLSWSDIAENTVLSIEVLFPCSSCSVFVKVKGSIPGISKPMSYLLFYILSLIISAPCFLILYKACSKLCLVMKNLFLFTARHDKVPWDIMVNSQGNMTYFKIIGSSSGIIHLGEWVNDLFKLAQSINSGSCGEQ